MKLVLNLKKTTISLDLPDWLLGYFETGWERYRQGLDFEPSTVGHSFENFEEYVSWVVGELVKADYERFKTKQKEDIAKISGSIQTALKKSLNKKKQ